MSGNANDYTLVAKEKLDAAEWLNNASLATNTPDEIVAKLGELVDGYTALGMGRSFEQTWFRARKWDEGKPFANVSDLIYKAGGSPSFGRCSYPGDEVLYAGWNVPTALAEIRAQPGDVVQVALLRVAPWHDLPCHVIGEMQSLYHAGRSQINSTSLEEHWQFIARQGPQVASHVFVDSVLADHFSRTVRDEDNDHYVLTASFARRMMASGGFMYPSVASKRNMNLAITSATFKQQFEVLGCLTLRIKDAAGFSLYSCEPIDQSFEIDQDGRFKWGTDLSVAPRVGNFGGLVLSPELRGWRHSEYVERTLPSFMPRFPRFGTRGLTPTY